MKFLKIAKKVLLWIWQFPQNIIGFCMTRKPEFISYCSADNSFPVYFTNNVFGAGVCLGDYILLDYSNYVGKSNRTDIKHEYGHHKQSTYLGWFYFIVIGIPSLCGNLIDRFFHKKWNDEKRCKWYYNLKWEKWADELGGVHRWNKV